MNRSVLFDRWIAAVIVVQLVGYFALAALIPHGSLESLVEPLRRVPAIVLAPVAVLAIPAVVLAIGIGEVLSVVGLEPTAVLLLVSAYVVSVTMLWVYRRTSGRNAEAR